MTEDQHRAMFNELCVELGFCSLGVDGEDEVVARLSLGVEQAARAVFAAEGLDYDTYGRKSVKAAVRDCIARHLEVGAAR